MGVFVQNPELMEEIQRVKGIVAVRHPEIKSETESKEEISEIEAEKYLEFLHRELRMHSRIQQSS